MTDNELLLAISNMIDPLREEIGSMKTELGSVKEELGSTKGEISSIKGAVSSIKGELVSLRADVSSLKEDMQDVKERVKKIELTQENKVLPRLNTIEACYISTFERYKEHVETYDYMKQDIYIIKKVVAEHSEKLQKLA
ncbi:MAG: hypothetical protein K2P41_15730 [Lachnospiraceae bacterium]|nr:hypothetical protein [Lachnospiraceae bacterium]